MGVGVDALLIEPHALVLTKHAIKAHVEAPLTVVHLSDLHTTGLGRRERAVLALVADAHPDVIVVTGDVVDTGDLEPARAFFAQLHAPLGVFVVRGNWEHWKPTAGDVDFYRSVNATLLVNEGRLIRHDVWVGGVDDPLSAHSDFRAARAGAPPNALPIFLLHAPVAFDDFARDGDLAFAGHTHGGQVRLPFVGAPWLPTGSRQRRMRNRNGNGNEDSEFPFPFPFLSLILL